MPALTRAEARDVIRRDKLNKLTSVEEFEMFGTGTNTVGAPASTHPTPTNAQINSQLSLAVGWVNRKTRLGHVEDVTVDVEAQSADGPFAIDLRSAPVGELLTPGDFQFVKRAYYDDGTDTYRIQPRSREEFDRERTEIQQQTVARGRWMWTEGYTLYLYPAPDTAGTLHLIGGTGILTFRDDADIIAQLPNDYHDVIWDTAAWFLARNAPNDAEMALIAQSQMAMAADGVRDILRLKQDASLQQEDTFAPQTDRVMSGRGRRGRSGRVFTTIPD